MSNSSLEEANKYSLEYGLKKPHTLHIKSPSTVSSN